MKESRETLEHMPMYSGVWSQKARKYLNCVPNE